MSKGGLPPDDAVHALRQYYLSKQAIASHPPRIETKLDMPACMQRAHCHLPDYDGTTKQMHVRLLVAARVRYCRGRLIKM